MDIDNAGDQQSQLIEASRGWEIGKLLSVERSGDLRLCSFDLGAGLGLDDDRRRRASTKYLLADRVINTRNDTYRWDLGGREAAAGNRETVGANRNGLESEIAVGLRLGVEAGALR